jgi:hypothetical protein
MKKRIIILATLAALVVAACAVTTMAVAAKRRRPLRPQPVPRGPNVVATMTQPEGPGGPIVMVPVQPEKPIPPFSALLTLVDPSDDELAMAEDVRRTFERLMPENEGRLMTYADLEERTGARITGWYINIRKIRPTAKGWTAEIRVGPQVLNAWGGAAGVSCTHEETWSWDGRRLRLIKQKAGDGYAFMIG